MTAPRCFLQWCLMILLLLLDFADLIPPGCDPKLLGGKSNEKECSGHLGNCDIHVQTV